MPNSNNEASNKIVYIPKDIANDEILDRWHEFEHQLTGQELERAQLVFNYLREWNIPASMLATYIEAFKINKQGQENHNYLLAEGSIAQKFLALEYNPIQDESYAAKKARLRALFYTAYTNADLILLLLASHLARMDKISSQDYQYTRRICEENEVVFMPIMEMLGVWGLRRKYGNWGLQALNPHKILRKIEFAIQNAEPTLKLDYDKLIELLGNELERNKIKARVSPHPCSNATLYTKMARGEPISNSINRLRINIEVETEPECYLVLHLLHKFWAPPPGRALTGSNFQDRIANPKFNGYRSLLTNLGFVSENKAKRLVPVDFRVCTQEMSKTNDMGIIAARYQSLNPIIIKNAWWEDVELLDFVRKHPLDDKDGNEIYVFSPPGKIYRRLPRNSTPIDYAYRVHTDVGDHCKSVKVNGERALYSRILNMGDIVEVDVDVNYPGPDKRWLEFAKTSTAREHINLVMHKQSPSKGRQIINKVLDAELHKYNLAGQISEEDVQNYLERAARKLGLDINALYIEIAHPDKKQSGMIISPNKLVSRFIFEKLYSQIGRKDGNPIGFQASHVRFAECQLGSKKIRVAVGCEIVGRVEQLGKPFSKLIVYRKDCKNAPQGDDSIPLEWIGNRRHGEPVKAEIDAVDRPQLLGIILQHIYKLYDKQIYLLALSARVSKERQAKILLTVDAPDHQAIEIFSDELSKIKREGIVDEIHINALSPLEKIKLRESSHIPNPYVTVPVFDRRTFKGRDAEVNKIIESLQGNQNLVVLYGLNRVGKTSLLRYIQTHVANEYNQIPVLIDMQSLIERNEYSFWVEFGRQIGKALLQFHSGKRANFHPFSPRHHENVYEAFLIWLREIKRSFSLQHLLIMVDEFSLVDEENWKDRKEADQLIYRLKSLVENEQDIHFVLCVQETLFRQTRKAEPNLISWPLLRSGVHVRLSYLDRNSAEKLIREPMGQVLHFDAEIVNEIIFLTACHPYYLNHLLYQIVNFAKIKQIKNLTTNELQATLPDLLMNGAYIFQHFMADCQAGIQREVLFILARLSGKQNAPVSAQEVLEQFPRLSKSDHRFQSILKALDGLCESEILRKKYDVNSEKFVFQIPLFSLWLQENHL